MSDDLDRLKAAMQTTPTPEKGAKLRAIDAGMAAFEENFQGSADAARPTREQAQWWALISRGVREMLKRLTTREALLTTASLATIAVAVVVSGQFTKIPGLDPVTVFDENTALLGQSDIGSNRIDDMAAMDAVSAQSAPAPLELEASDQGFVAPMAEVREQVGGGDMAKTVTSGIVAEVEEGDISYGAITAPVPAEAPMALTRSREATAGIARTYTITDSESPLAQQPNTEQFPDADVNPLKVTTDTPVSTFSIDVDTASYSFVRSSIMGGQLPPKDAVRTEEMINYFSYDYPVPERAEAPFTTSVTVLDTPWNPDTKLMHIGIKGYELPVEDRPAVNLVFLVDTSGSMQDSNKLPLLINSFRLMLNNLQPDDQVAIVTYAGSAGVVLEPTAASETVQILASLENLYAGGSTAGMAGLQQAYALAEQMGQDGDTSRVILATDGDFNVGISDPDKLKEYVEDKRDTGVYLSVLGFGRGNYNDTLMQTLAQNGNGTAAYIDTLAEAQKVLVDQIGGALFTIAQDVKIQVEFNPAEIAEYRLIGYETRALNREDFNNDTVDAGEIGAGHSVTAIYEITPVGSPAVRVDALRYGTDEPDSLNTGEYAFLKLRYKNPGEDTSILITTPVTADSNANLGSEPQFAAAVAGFGQILRGDTLMNGWTINDARKLAEASKGVDAFGYRAELVTLMRLADSLK